MADLNLTQAEADVLIALEKHCVNNDRHDFPLGGRLELFLESADKREQFILDISQARIDLSKVKYQNRSRQAVVLVRLDLAGRPHRNPDGQEISCPHLHVYREGYGDKWADLAPVEDFGRTSDAWDTLEDFMRFCNITRPPNIERGLFT